MFIRSSVPTISSVARRATIAASALILAIATGFAGPAGAVSTTPLTVMADAATPTLVVARLLPGHSLCGDRLGHAPSARTLQSCRVRSFDAMQAQLATLKANAR